MVTKLRRIKMETKKLEISSIHSVGGWNGTYGGTLQINIPIDQFGEENPRNDTYKTCRMDVTDLLVFLNKTNPEYEIIEPKGNRKYIYIRPLLKGEKK
jgi:hypothetical protein